MKITRWLAALTFAFGIQTHAWAEDSSEEDPVAPASEKKERHDWDRDLYVAPILSWASYHSGDSRNRHLLLGAAAGINYKQKKLGPKLKGYSRVQALRQVGLTTTGRDLRAGAFVGPAFGPVALTVGPDVFTSESSYGCGDGQSNGGNCVHLDSVVGVGVPLMLTGDILLARAYVGVIPSWYVSGSRPGVGDNGFLGLGDEQALVLGAKLRLVLFHLGFSYQLNQDVYGTRHQGGVNVGLGL